MTNPTPHGQVPAIQRYKIGYHSDEWGVPAGAERAAFEANWCERNHPVPLNSRLRDDGRYGDHLIQSEWEAWQASAARAQADSVLEDAARYRWLRDTANSLQSTGPLVFNAPGDGSEMKWTYALYGAALDNAVDAARKQGANHD